MLTSSQGDTPMSTSKAKLSARITTGFALPTTSAALWMAFAGAAAAGTGRQISPARAMAVHECSVLAARYSQHDWGNTEIYQYRACMAQRGEQE
jgi:hypothetical protein